MKSKVCPSLLFLLLISTIGTIAQESAKDTLTLEQCINIAVRENPLILSSYQQHQAALAALEKSIGQTLEGDNQ